MMYLQISLMFELKGLTSRDSFGTGGTGFESFIIECISKLLVWCRTLPAVLMLLIND